MSDFIAGISTRWLTEEVFKLIDLVQRDEAIYNPRHKYYFCRPYVENFWREVDQKLDKNPGASLAKWTNLRISFRREFTNYLEEKVPPCWSYFDRMFFLHPYLRKKQQQPTTKQGETALQETLAQIGELSNRLERQAAEKANKPTSSSTSIQQNAATSSYSQQHSNSDNYFDYYDEPTEQNNSELEDIMEDEQRQLEAATRYPQVILETPSGVSPHHQQQQIKSETEDEIADDEYEMRREMLLDAEIGSGEEMSPRQDSSNSPLHLSNLHHGRATKRSHHSNSQQQMRLDHLNRLQTRSYHDDLRAKRPRSQERQTTTYGGQRLPAVASTTASLHASSSNVSFVRPTVSKSLDAVTLYDASLSAANQSANLPISTAAGASFATSSATAQSARYFNANTSNTLTLHTANNASGNTFNNAPPARQNISPSSVTAATPHVELCDCKTDPDAMFLMSLLPDIQKLNGRDRGKIKIAFQNILQDYLYPD